MSLRGYKPTTKPALWTTLPNARKALQRATGRAGKPKPGKGRRKPVRSVSAKRAKELTTYRLARAALLAPLPWCEACNPLFGAKFPAVATEIHHSRGKSGNLLCDARHFRLVCATCHRFIHDHPTLARSAGLLAPVGDWGRGEK